MKIRVATFSILTSLKLSNVIFHSFIFCCLAVMSFAQVNQISRFEIPQDENTNDYRVISLEDKGLLVYRRYFNKGYISLEITRMDTTLQKQWVGIITLDNSLSMQQARVSNGNVFILFKQRNSAKSDFQVLEINCDTGAYDYHLVSNAIPFNPSEFIITQNAAWIGGYFNYRPVIVHYNFNTQTSKALPGFFNEPGELNQLKAYTNGSVDVVVIAKNLERKKCLWIRNYNPEGNLIKTTVIEPEAKKNFIYGRSVKIQNDEQIVGGVYGRNTEYSRGLFIASVNPYGEYSVNYYNFADLSNFFNYMKDDKQRRVKNRIERRKVNGKKIKFNYRFLVHDIIPYGNQYILLGEAFYPTYIYPAYYKNFQRFAYDPRIKSDIIFDEFQYTHAMIIGFNKDGKLTWDNSFELNDVKARELTQFVKIQTEQSRIVLLYLFQNQIRSKIIKDSKVLEGLTQEEMKTKYKSDESNGLDTETSHLDHWYKNYFFAYGIQNVKNLTEGDVSLHRKVFFINKLNYK